MGPGARFDERPNRLTGTDHASAPFWSPDGTAIAFFANRKLKKILLHSGVVQELADVPRSVAGGSWSRDGTILYRRAGRRIASCVGRRRTSHAP